ARGGAPASRWPCAVRALGNRSSWTLRPASPARWFTVACHAVIPSNVRASSAITARRISVLVIPTSFVPLGVVVVVDGGRVVVVGRDRVVVTGACVVGVVVGLTRSVVPGLIVAGGSTVGGSVVGAAVDGASGTVSIGEVEVVPIWIDSSLPPSPDPASNAIPAPMNAASAATPARIQYCRLVMAISLPYRPARSA